MSSGMVPMLLAVLVLTAALVRLGWLVARSSHVATSDHGRADRSGTRRLPRQRRRRT